MMFQYAISFEGDISKWDVSSVTNMGGMFTQASSFNADISKWDVSKVTNMGGMFHHAKSFSRTLCGAWQKSKASSSSMLAGSPGKLCIPTSATPKSKAELTAAIKECLKRSDFDCSKGPHGPIGSWDISAVTNLGSSGPLFAEGGWSPLPGADKFNGDISKWDVSRVTNMGGLFYKLSSFKAGDLSKWDVSKVTNMWRMFVQAKVFNGDLSKWDVSSVTNNMASMFYAAQSFNGDISKLDVSKVTRMEMMFQYAISFEGDISKWDVSSVTNMGGMFHGAKSFSKTLCGAWQKSKASAKSGMFSG